MIRFERASFVYRADAATSERGVHDVSISVRPGQVAVVCGRSGCGKSTLLRMANGLAPRFFPGRRSGRVLLDDEDVGGLAAWEIAERAGSLFQNPRTQFFNVDTTGEVAFALENAGWPSERIRARVERTLRELGLEDLADRSIFRLSGGQRQKIAYASVWALRPANLLLDEPTSNLDADSIEAITAFVAAAKTTGRSILVAEHRLTWLSGLADTYIHLDSGRITRVMSADEFAALDPRELDSMGLRARNLDDVAPAAQPARRPAVNTTGEALRNEEDEVARSVSRTTMAIISGMVVVMLVCVSYAVHSILGLANLPFFDPALPAASTLPTPIAQQQADQTSEPTKVPITITGARAVNESGGEGDHPENAGKTVDGDPATTWESQHYNSSKFGNLKSGTGIAVTLEQAAEVSGIDIQGTGSGGNVQIRATSPEDPTGGTVLAEGAFTSGTTSFTFTPTSTQSIVLWVNDLPTASDGQPKVSVSEITLK